MNDHIRSTEARNAHATDLDLWPSEPIIRAALEEDSRGVAAVASVASPLAIAGDAALASDDGVRYALVRRGAGR